MDLSQESRIKWKGYMLILETAQPNGRYNHNRCGVITVIRVCLYMGVEPPEGFEPRVKQLIRVLYPQEHVGNSYQTA